ncbi:MAG: alpha/beta hydrolase [Paludibacteraceae bacterium]
MKTLKYILFLMLILSISCAKTPEIDNLTMLDGDKIFDLSLTQPEDFLISAKYPNPTEIQKNIPVIIAAHGYSATTFEWEELREYADSAGTFYVSRVLLGGHGRTYKDFKQATWKDWQSSILEEYKKISDLGYKNIYLAGSSTGCPLFINMIKSGFFTNFTKPKKFFLIDPIIISSNKTLTLVAVLGPVLGHTSSELSSGEQGKWYVYRPYQTLQQLMNLIDLTRKDLENGIILPPETKMKTFKSISDNSADPVSAVLIYKGMKNSDGSETEVQMVNSKLHVFTRLKGRDGVTSSDRALQLNTFREMEKTMINN